MLKVLRCEDRCAEKYCQKEARKMIAALDNGRANAGYKRRCLFIRTQLMPRVICSRNTMKQQLQLYLLKVLRTVLVVNNWCCKRMRHEQRFPGDASPRLNAPTRFWDASAPGGQQTQKERRMREAAERARRTDCAGTENKGGYGLKLQSNGKLDLNSHW